MRIQFPLTDTGNGRHGGSGLISGDHNYQTTRLSGMKLGKAILGTPLRIIFGTQRTTWDLVWYGDFQSTHVQEGGSGFGKGGSQWVYNASVIGIVCQGPVVGLGSVWDNQGKFVVEQDLYGATVPLSAPYTIQVPNAFADPAQTNLVFVADNGVTQTATINPKPSPVFNPATAYSIRSFAIQSNQVTMRFLTSIAGGQQIPTPTVGEQVQISGMRVGTYLNGVTLTISSATAGSFTASFTHANVATTVDYGTATQIVNPGPTPTPIPMNNSGTGDPTEGQYSYDPATGIYTFNPADAGAAVMVGYQYYRYIELAEELQVVPLVANGNGNYQVTVDNQPYFESSTTKNEGGVYYFPSGVGLTERDGVSTGNLAKGQYNPNGGNYLFSAADAGAAITIHYGWKNPNTSANSTNYLALTLLNGAKGQQPWPYMTSSHPGQAMGYTEACYVASPNLYLGYTTAIPNYNFEIVGMVPFGGGILDANPADCIAYALSDEGAGIGFPSQYIDSSLMTLARDWWTANGFFISEVVEGQSSVSDVCGKWLEAGQVAAFFSEGVLKFVPYGDQLTTGNGAVYYPPTTPAAVFTDSDYLPRGKNEPPLKVTRIPWMDAYNKVRGRWRVRSNDYNADVIEASDEARIQQFGLRIEQPQNWEFITTLTSAQFAATMRLHRYSAIRNTYEFNLKDKWAAILEPMCIVLLNDTRLGIVNKAVRIIEVTDDPERGLSIKAEDFPFGVSQPAVYNTQVNAPSADIVYGHASPGETIPTIIEIPSILSNGQGYTVYILAAGANANWGGCTVWVSFNGVDYTPYDKIRGASRTGTLTAPLPNATDPDTVDTLSVEMNAPDSNLVGVTQPDADAFITLSAILNSTANPPKLELISYRDVNLTGANEYNFNYLRRGLYGTTPQTHGIGEEFARLDNTVLQYQYPAKLVGQTIYLKFTSFNLYEQNEEQIQNVTAYPFVLQGSGPPTIVSFVGTWNSTTEYYVGQEVAWNGNFYYCLVANTGQQPDISPTYWTVHGTASAFLGAYSNTVQYQPGQGVIYQGAYYVCILATIGNLPTNTTYWATGASQSNDEYLGAWNSSTAYLPGNQVTYQNGYYICIANSTNNPPATSPSEWQVVGSQNTYLYLGPYNGTTSYTTGNQVTYNGSYWICISPVQGSAPSLYSSYWTLVGTSALFIGAYSGTTAYVPGNEVTYNGNYYVCILATTGNLPTNTTYWQVVGPATLDALSDGSIYGKVKVAALASGVPYLYKGPWVNSTAYVQGNEVTYQGNYYVCILNNTGQTPAPAGTSYWICLGPTSLDQVIDGSVYGKVRLASLASGVPYTFLGTWSGATAYVQGNEVVYQGNYYICIANNTNQNPSSQPTYWTLVGTSAQFIGPYSGTVQYQVGNQVTYQGSYYICIQASLGNVPTNIGYWQLVGTSATFLGAWSSSTAYVIGNEVTYNGSFYICIQNNTNQVPTNQTYWQAVSQQSTEQFLGAYSNSYSYVPGNQVTYNGSYWICILNSTGNAPTLSSIYWTLVGTSAIFVGAWSGVTAYVPGNQVTYHGSFYICIAPSTGNLPTDGSYWVAVSTPNLFLGAYNNGESYYAGNEVTYQGGYYKCILDSTGNAPTNTTYWQAVGQNTSVYLGAYAGGTSYVPGNQVSYNSGYYICILATTGNLPTNGTYWQLISGANSSIYAGAYSAGASYVPGNQVTFNGSYYICILATTGNDPTNGTYWQLVSSSNSNYYVGAYSGATAYVPGNEVTYNGSFWICISNTTGNAPTVPSSYWTLLGTSVILLGAWSGSTAYVVGNEVTFNGNIYRCIAANTNQQPPNATYWTLMGTSSEFLGAYSGATAYVPGNQVTYNGSYYICTAATTGNLPTNGTYWQLVSGVSTGIYIGPYNGATAYVPGNQVTYQGSYYICIANTTGNAPPNATYWQLVSVTNNYIYLGGYNPATAYVAGNQVSWQGSFWICISATTGNAPAQGSSYWTLVGTSALFIGAWSSSVTYQIGNEVTYQGGYYKCVSVPPVGTAPTNATYWILVGTQKMFVGAWSASIAYAIGNEVTYNGYYYTCIQATTAGIVPTNTSYWQAMGTTAAAFQGNWASATQYYVGNQVIDTNDGGYYVCIAASLNNRPSLSPLYWQVVTAGSLNAFAGTWASGTSYGLGDVVLYQGSLYVAIVASTGQTPSLTSTYWTLIGSNAQFMGTWSNSTAYQQNMIVAYNGNVYQCKQGNTNQAPPSAAYWYLLGPATLDNLVDGTIYIRGTQYESNNIVIPNANFEASASLPVPGWSPTASATLAYETSAPFSGAQSLKLTTTAQYAAAVSIKKWACSPGDQFYVSGAMKSDGTGQPEVQLVFLDKNGSNIGGIAVAAGIGTTWGIYSASGSAPTGAVACVVYLQNNRTGGTGACWFDAITVDLINALPGITAYRPLSNPLTAIDAGSNATIDIASFNMGVAGTGINTSGQTIIPYGSGALTGLLYNTAYYVWVDDQTLGGTAGAGYTYGCSQTREDAFALMTRMFIGSITTPQAGGAPTVGNNDGGAGAQYAKSMRNLAQTYSATVAGTGAWINPQNAIDNNLGSFAEADSNATTGNMTYIASGFLPLAGWFTNNTLIVTTQVLGIQNGTVYVDYSADGGNTWINLRAVTTPDTNGLVTSSVVLGPNVLPQNVWLRVISPGAAAPQSTNTDYAGIAANDATVGTVPWTSPSNAEGNQTTNWAYAQNSNVSGTNTIQSDYLKLSNFGFSIPSGATINGIEVAAYVNSNSFFETSGTPPKPHYINVTDASIKLYKAGALVGSNRAKSGNWPSTDGPINWGDSSDLWGTTWAQADINNSGFGVGISVNITNGLAGPGEADVAWVSITVYYTLSSGSPTTAQTQIWDIAQLVTT